MKISKKYSLLVYLMICVTSFSWSQDIKNPTLKVGVYYTQQALDYYNANSTGTTFEEHLNIQENEVKNILTDINNSLGLSVTYDIKFINKTKLSYVEPAYRDGGDYITNKYDGKAQVLEEIMNHEVLMTYYEDNPSASPPGGFKLNKSEIDNNFVTLDLLTWTDINIILVDEEDGVKSIIDTNVWYDNSTNTGKSDDPLYAAVSAKRFTESSNSLATVIFSLLSDPNEIDISYDEFRNITGTSLLGYWLFEDGITISNELSNDNQSLFQCNISEIKLESPETHVVNTNIKNVETQSIVDAVNHSIIIPVPVTT